MTDAELTKDERRLLDDLRWCAGRLEQIDGPGVAEMRAELALLLSDWTNHPHTYSNGTPVALIVQPQHHLYAPPHRRGDSEGNSSDRN